MNHRVWPLMPWARGITFLLALCLLFFDALWRDVHPHVVRSSDFPIWQISRWQAALGRR